MKKIVLFSLAVAALGLASCKKERTCTCTGTTTDVQTITTGASTTTSTTSSPESYTDVLTKATKGVAKSKRDCMSRTKTSTSEYTVGSTTTKDVVTTDLDCTIK